MVIGKIAFRIADLLDHIMRDGSHANTWPRDGKSHTLVSPGLSLKTLGVAATVSAPDQLLSNSG